MADMDWGDDNNDAGWNDDAGWGDAGCGDDGWGDTNDASSDWGKGGDAWEPVIADSDAPKATLYNVFDRKGANDRRIEIIQAKADDQELPADEVDLLLRYIGFDNDMKWNEFMSNQAVIRKVAGVTGEWNKVPRSSASTIECPTCLDDVPLADAFALNCGHYQCNECWTHLLKVQLKDSRGAVFARCPGMIDEKKVEKKEGKQQHDMSNGLNSGNTMSVDMNMNMNANMNINTSIMDGGASDADDNGSGVSSRSCKEKIPFSVFEKFLLPNYEGALDKLSRWVLDQFISNTRSFSFCSGKNCDRVIEYSMGGAQDVVCKCKTEFCFGCKGPAHSPVPCDLAKKWIETTDEDKASLKLIKAITKQCPQPQCKLVMSKDRHCNHMICPQCNHHFCWLCLQPFIIDSNNHPTYDDCLVTARKVQSGKADKEIEQGKLLAKLTLHQKHFNDCAKIRRHAHSIKTKLEQKFDKEGSSGLSFLLPIVDQAQETQRFIQWSWVFSFFLDQTAGKMAWSKRQNIIKTEIDSVITRLAGVVHDSYAWSAFKSEIKTHSSLKKAGRVMKEETERMLEQVERLNEELLNEAKANSRTWACVRCEKEHDSETIVCDAPGCGACKAHGEQDCLIAPCKKPSWVCGACTKEHGMDKIVCDACHYCKAHNRQQCPKQPCRSATPQF